MALSALWQVLELELKTLEHEFINFVAKKASVSAPGEFSLVDLALLEGLLSRAWQAWGHFCRSCVMESCLGTVDANGQVVLAVVSHGNERTVSGAAVHIKGKKNGSCWAAPPNSVLRFEPTWGDTSVLETQLSKMLPSNHAQLRGGFSAAHSFAKTLQTIRNAAAHTNVETINEVNLLQPAYVGYSITDPLQSLFWIHHATSDFLIITAIDELLDGALVAIQ